MMNLLDLSSVEFGDDDGLKVFLFENAQQHQLFRHQFLVNNLLVPGYNLFDVELENIDDWMLPHQVEHQQFATYLGLQNPINLLDFNWNEEGQFYDFISTHLQVHQNLISALGLA
jgi:hypothetical protein